MCFKQQLLGNVNMLNLPVEYFHSKLSCEPSSYHKGLKDYLKSFTGSFNVYLK